MPHQTNPDEGQELGQDEELTEAEMFAELHEDIENWNAGIPFRPIAVLALVGTIAVEFGLQALAPTYSAMCGVLA